MQRPFKIAYLILAHNNPLVLKRAIATLSCEDCEFFVHIDKKSSMAKFSGIGGENVHFSETRLPVYWGEFSIVQATLQLLRMALKGPETPNHCVLMSGCDYPLRSARYVREFLATNHGLEFMNLVKVPAPGKPLSRINTVRFQSDKPVRRFVVRVLAKLGLAQRDYRKYLGNLEPYSGSQWWGLTREACQYLLDFVQQNQHVVKYFENVFAADEAFFHTILGNSPFKSRIRRNLVFEDWSGSVAHPKMISDEHIALFEARDELRVNDVFGDGESLFARKFSDTNLELLQRIDEMIERKERALYSNTRFQRQKTVSAERR
jgi:hypothetical protein